MSTSPLPRLVHLSRSCSAASDPSCANNDATNDAEIFSYFTAFDRYSGCNDHMFLMKNGERETMNYVNAIHRSEFTVCR